MSAMHSCTCVQSQVPPTNTGWVVLVLMGAAIARSNKCIHSLISYCTARYTNIYILLYTY